MQPGLTSPAVGRTAAIDDDLASIAAGVGAFYERHPYPPAIDDLADYGSRWDDHRRRADACLFWPAEPYRDDRSILVAGCGTSQAAKYALRWPHAQVTGIDVSEASLAFTESLKRKYGLQNLELRRLEVERARELGRTFGHVACTGVLHHLADPDAGLRALREVLAPGGALHLMVYAPYGRAGVYLIQDYCRRLGLGVTAAEIGELALALGALPRDHPIAPLLRNSPDFRTPAGLADALLHPHDRAYSVPQLLEFLQRAGLSFGRWLRQAPYLPQCGAPAATPHRQRLRDLRPEEQYAAMELFRGTMVRHSLVAYRSDRPGRATGSALDWETWPDLVPIRLPDTITVKERLPPGAAAVLINRSHTYADLVMPIDAEQEGLLAGVDGRRTIAAIAGTTEPRAAVRDLFEQLWRYDQIVFDASQAQPLDRASRVPR